MRRWPFGVIWRIAWLLLVVAPVSMALIWAPVLVELVFHGNASEFLEWLTYSMIFGYASSWGLWPALAIHQGTLAAALYYDYSRIPAKLFSVLAAMPLFFLYLAITDLSWDLWLVFLGVGLLSRPVWHPPKVDAH